MCRRFLKKYTATHAWTAKEKKTRARITFTCGKLYVRILSERSPVPTAEARTAASVRARSCRLTSNTLRAKWSIGVTSNTPVCVKYDFYHMLVQTSVRIVLISDFYVVFTRILRTQHLSRQTGHHYHTHTHRSLRERADLYSHHLVSLCACGGHIIDIKYHRCGISYLQLLLLLVLLARPSRKKKR